MTGQIGSINPCTHVLCSNVIPPHQYHHDKYISISRNRTTKLHTSTSTHVHIHTPPMADEEAAKAEKLAAAKKRVRVFHS